jgi:hypothetical protein
MSEEEFVPDERIELMSARPKYWGPYATVWDMPHVNGWMPNQIGRHIVYAPSVHPFLEYFYLGLVSLCMSTSKEAHVSPKVVQPGANFEIHLYACDPQKKPCLNYPPNIIMPQLFASQWYSFNQVYAEAAYHQVMMEVCMGTVPILPTEGKNEWVLRFGYHTLLVNGMSIQDSHRLYLEMSDQQYQ